VTRKWRTLPFLVHQLPILTEEEMPHTVVKRYFHVTSPRSPYDGAVGLQVKQTPCGWITLRFWDQGRHSFLTPHLTATQGPETGWLILQDEDESSSGDVSWTTLERLIIAGDLSAELDYDAHCTSSRDASPSPTSGQVSKTSVDVLHGGVEVLEALVADVATLVWHTCWMEPWLAVSLRNLVNDMFCIQAAEAPR